MASSFRLFDDAALRKLEQLSLTANAVRVGALKGDRRSRRRGTSIEFADYRDYTPGDDLRRLDWNVFARHDRPFIKVTQDEEDLAVHILIDTSSSMNWPPIDLAVEAAYPEQTNKLSYAFRLAGALGYIGLSSGDLVSVVTIDNRGQQAWGPYRSRQNGWPLIQYLEASHNSLTDLDFAATPRKTDLNTALRNYALRARRPGLLFLLSDLYPSMNESNDGFKDGLQALQSRGYEPVVLHLLSPDEAMPDMSGDLKFIDVETGDEAEVSLDTIAIEQYIERFQAWTAEIGGYCRSRDVYYVTTLTDQPWEDLILKTLRQQGVVS